jgi:hypothetical protein
VSGVSRRGQAAIDRSDEAEIACIDPDLERQAAACPVFRLLQGRGEGRIVR